MGPVDRFLVWWLRTGRYGWSRIRRRLFEGRYRALGLPVVNSLDDVQRCLQEVTWTMDGLLHLFDCISYPETTWAKKRDECDGFASLAAVLLRQVDPACNPVLVTVLVRPVRKSHTVCAFSGAEGRLCFFDNSLLRSEGFESYGAVAAEISRSAGRLVCWDVREPATLHLREFHRT